MMQTKTILSFILAVFLSSLLYGQLELLDVQAKDLDDNEFLFKDGLDDQKNYMFLAFSVDDEESANAAKLFLENMIYWSQRYDMKFILLEENYYNDINYIKDQLASNELDVELWRINEGFSDFAFEQGTNLIISKHQDKIVKVTGLYCTWYETVFKREFIFNAYEPMLEDDFSQQILTKDCEKQNFIKTEQSIDTFIFDKLYYEIGPMLLCEHPDWLVIERYHEDSEGSVRYLDFHKSVCDRVSLVDFEGDEMTVIIKEVIEGPNNIRLVTDHFIQTDCPQDSIAFELIQGIGTNAGLIFDIENGEIVSQLICHYKGDGQIYLDESIGQLCDVVGTIEQNEHTQEVVIFPNPAQNQVFLLFSDDTKKDIYIQSINGMQYHNSSTKELNHSIDISKLIPGMYFLVIQNSVGFYVRKKLIVE